MVDSGHEHTPTIGAVPDRTLDSIDDLSGFDLQAIHKALGKPLVAALDGNDESGMFAWYWRARIRAGDTEYTLDDALGVSFGTVVEAFAKANAGAQDPTSARSGDA